MQYEYMVFVENILGEYIPYNENIYTDRKQAYGLCDMLNRLPDIIHAMVFYREVSDWEQE